MNKTLWMNIEFVSVNSYRNTWNINQICCSLITERDQTKIMTITIMIWVIYSPCLKWSENMQFHSHKNKKKCLSSIWRDKINSVSFWSSFSTKSKTIQSTKSFTSLMKFGKSSFSSKTWITLFSKLSSSLMHS